MEINPYTFLCSKIVNNIRVDITNNLAKIQVL